MITLLETADKFSARLGSAVRLLPVVIRWEYEIAVEAVRLERDPESWLPYLNWSDRTGTAPVLWLPENWNGDRFPFVPVDESEPEGDMCPASTDEEEVTVGFCRLASDELAEQLVVRGGDAICLLDGGTDPAYEAVDNWFWDRGM